MDHQQTCPPLLPLVRSLTFSCKVATIFLQLADLNASHPFLGILLRLEIHGESNRGLSRSDELARLTMFHDLYPELILKEKV